MSTDPTSPQAQLAAYIQKQLAASTQPKDLLNLLLEKNVPRETAIQAINQGIQQRQAAQSASAPPASGSETQRQKIVRYIQAKSQSGLSTEDILADLISKKVPEANARALLEEAINPPGQPSQKELVAALEEKLNAGIELQDLVESLIDGGMARNEAINLVMDTNERLKREQGIGEPTSAERERSAKGGGTKMAVGCAAILGGGLLTAASYAAADAGGTYSIFYGLIVYGFFSMISGFIDWARNN